MSVKFEQGSMDARIIGYWERIFEQELMLFQRVWASREHGGPAAKKEIDTVIARVLRSAS